LGKIESLNGNQAVAHGVRLARVNVVPAYPITPQTTVVEYISNFVNDGELKARFIESEGEHGMMGQAIGASATGARVFTATCSQGLAYAYEQIVSASERRLPIVAAIINRPIDGFWPDHTDSLSVRDWPWIQIYVENAQEALDTILQAYKIAEDARVSLPIFVCVDGFYLSYTTELVNIPDQEEVDRFLPPFKPAYHVIDPKNPASFTIGMGLSSMAVRVASEEALRQSKKVIQEVAREFEEKFGRSYGNGLVETFMMDDAEAALVTMGSMTGSAREAVEELRKEGKKVGLIKLRTFRPFPREDFQRITPSLKVLAVCDRNVVQGTEAGAMLLEIKNALWYQPKKPLIIGFIAGLRGTEVGVRDFKLIAEKALRAANEGRVEKEIEWYPPVEVVIKKPEPIPKDKLAKMAYPGTSACQGCGMVLTYRHMLDVLGRDAVYVQTAGCMGWMSTAPGKTALTIPAVFSWLPAGSATTSGVYEGLRSQGKDEGVNVVLFTGDGSYGDMGFMAGSGSAERNDNIIVQCYDNEGYMNTGGQRSGTTPHKAATTDTPVGTKIAGKLGMKKDLPSIMAAHHVPYVATASTAYMADFKRKLEKASKIKGFKYIHVLSPCPTGWRYPSENLMEIGRRAVQSGFWPLYEIEDGKTKVTMKVSKRIPVRDYLMMQGRFRHLTEDDIKAIQEMTDRNYERLLRQERLDAEPSQTAESTIQP